MTVWQKARGSETDLDSGTTSAGIGLLRYGNSEKAKGIDFEGIAVRHNVVGERRRAMVGRRRRGTRQTINVREEYTQIGTQALEDAGLVIRWKRRKIPNQRVDPIEHILLLHAEQLLVG